MDFEILPPGERDTRYDYRIRNRESGAWAPARLNYDLSVAGGARNLVVVRERDIQGVCPDWVQTPRYRRFRSAIAKVRAQAGNVELVKRLAERADASGDWGATVHRFGPVPASRVDAPVLLDLAGQPIEARLAIYPQLGGAPVRASAVPRALLLRTYRIDFPRLVRKYLEDIGGCLWDIQHLASRCRVLDLTKRVEETAAQSLDTKLTDLLAGLEPGAEPYSRAEAEGLLGDHLQDVLAADFGRLYTLRVVNELFRLLGLVDACDKYRAEWGAHRAYWESRTGSISAPLVQTLERALGLLDSGAGLDGFVELTAQSPQPEWLNQLVGFARFLRILQLQGMAPGSPGVYLGFADMDLPEADLMQRVERVLGGRAGASGPRIRILAGAVGSAPPEEVMSRLWVSDAFGLFARDVNPQLVQTLDFGLLLDKSAHCFAVGSGDPEVLVESIAVGPKIRWPEGEQRVVATTESRSRLREAAGLVDTLAIDSLLSPTPSPEVRDTVEHLALAASHRYLEELICGFLMQFPPADRRALSIAMRHASFGRTKAYLVSRIAAERGGHGAVHRRRERIRELREALRQRWRASLDLGGKRLDKLREAYRALIEDSLMPPELRSDEAVAYALDCLAIRSEAVGAALLETRSAEIEALWESILRPRGQDPETPGEDRRESARRRFRAACVVGTESGTLRQLRGQLSDCVTTAMARYTGLSAEQRQERLQHFQLLLGARITAGTDAWRDAALEFDNLWQTLIGLIDGDRAKAAGDFKRAWIKLKSRKLALDGEPIELILRERQGNTHLYRSNLPELVGVLRPELGEADRREYGSVLGARIAERLG